MACTARKVRALVSYLEIYLEEVNGKGRRWTYVSTRLLLHLPQHLCSCTAAVLLIGRDFLKNSASRCQLPSNGHTAESAAAVCLPFTTYRRVTAVVLHVRSSRCGWHLAENP